MRVFTVCKIPREAWKTRKFKNFSQFFPAFPTFPRNFVHIGKAGKKAEKAGTLPNIIIPSQVSKLSQNFCM